VLFTPDGNNLLSPVGNRVNLVDLVQGRTVTLPAESSCDITILALSPDGKLLLSIDRSGRAHLLNFARGSILSRINFKVHVESARFSPNGIFIAVTHGRRLQIWRAPTLKLGWQFVKHHQYTSGHQDDIVDIAWAPNSLFIATCAKDMTVRLNSVDRLDGFEPLWLCDHRSPVRGVFFSKDMKHLFSMSRDGCLLSVCYNVEEDGEKEANLADGNVADRPLYCQPGEWTIANKCFVARDNTSEKVMRCAFDADARLLLAGFSSGVFMLFEMPEMDALQKLSLGTAALDAVALGAKGDWLAVGSAEIGQLLVWEWRSETYILKQQGHHWGVQCVAYSPAAASSLSQRKAMSTADSRPEDKGSMLAGRLLATGGYDGKIKLFNSQSGLCFVTFADHTAPVSALCFTSQGNAVLSASLDGSVRAFDLLRYRNFRTFASPDGLCQFSSLAVDSGGEIVAASTASGKYAIYVWSIQTGNVLEVLTAHTSFVQTLQFSPSVAHPGQLISGAWDGSLCVWDLFATKGGSAESLECSSVVLSVAFDPRGNDLCAASCLSGRVLFWNVTTAQNIGSIDGLRDIQSARQWHDKYSRGALKGIKKGTGLKKKGPMDNININQHFNAIAYARSGELLLCASRNSPHVCLYDTSSYVVAAKVILTRNGSLSGTGSLLHHSALTQDGVALNELNLSDTDADDIEVAQNRKRRRQEDALPGVTVGEAKDYYSERELHVWGVAFSSDAQQFAAATTHGVFVYSADLGIGIGGTAGSIFGNNSLGFAPQLLTKSVSEPAVLKALEAGDISRAMILALALNDQALLRRVYEKVPVKMIPVVIASVGSPLLPGLVWFLAREMKPSTGTPHFQFHMHWVCALIDLHFATLQDMSAGKSTARTGKTLEVAAASGSDVQALCLQLLVELSERHSTMMKAFDNNRYLLRYLGNAPSASTEEPDADSAEAAAEGATADGAEEAAIESMVPEPDEASGLDALKATARKKKKRRPQPEKELAS